MEDKNSVLETIQKEKKSKILCNFTHSDKIFQQVSKIIIFHHENETSLESTGLDLNLFAFFTIPCLVVLGQH